MSLSKPLGHDDDSAFAFVRELLGGTPTYAINFDRLQKHKVHGYIIFEFLLTDEKQIVTPETSHPNKYWHKNSRKFIALWQAASALNATLFLVNYAKLNTKHANVVSVIRVIELDEVRGIIKENRRNFSRAEFALWFRKLNEESR